MLLVALLVFRTLSGPAAVCAGGWRPARWPSAPRASLGASSFLRVLLVAPRVFRAPEGPAARETRRLRFARRRVSKPARALRSLRRPPHQWGQVADVCLCVVSKSGQAPPLPTGAAARPSRPCPPVPLAPSTPAGLVTLMGGSARRLVVRPSPAAAHGHRSQTLPSVPSGPSGALHTSGAGSLCEPGQAPPPPTGTAARPSGPSGALQPLQSTGAGQGIAQNADHFGENA